MYLCVIHKYLKSRLVERPVLAESGGSRQQVAEATNSPTVTTGATNPLQTLLIAAG